MFRKHQTAVIAIAATLAVSSCSTVAPHATKSGNFSLKAAFVHFRPNPVHVGDKVVFDYAVKNDGTNTVRGGSYLVDLYLDGRAISFDHATSEIPPGRSSRYTMASGYFDWQPTNAGHFHYQLVVSERHTRANSVLGGDIDVKPSNTALERAATAP